MASSPCDRRNPVFRSGTSQDQRPPPALDPGYAPVDERSLVDLVRFAERLSRQLRYRQGDNTEAGDWLPFFGKDVTAVLAGLAALPDRRFRDFADSLEAFLTDDPPAADTDLSNHALLLFHLPLLLLVEADGYYRRLPLRHPLRGYMETLVERDLKEPLEGLLGYYKGALGLADPLFADVAPDPVDYNTTDGPGPGPLLPDVLETRVEGASAVSGLDVSDDLLARIGPGGWSALYGGITADETAFDPGAAGLAEQIEHALGYNLLRRALVRVHQGLARVAAEAHRHLKETLEGHGAHTPHYGLWLAFLRLFETSQGHLNTLTGRHLDHYYREILRLTPRDAEPDRVHLLFELARDTEAHLLEEGTLFKAGKDDAGKRVVYGLDEDFVVNRAKVASLRGLFLPHRSVSGETRRLGFSASQVDSANGEGEKLPDDRPGWKPFGPETDPPAARLGFAVADRQLFLREGARTITLRATFEDALPGGLGAVAGSAFRALLTGEEEWIEPTDVTARVSAGNDRVLEIVVGLDGEAPPVVPWDAELHPGLDGLESDPAVPVMRVELDFRDHPDEAARCLALLHDRTFGDLDLSVRASGVRDLTLVGEAGVVDPSKPFLPFGPLPERGAGLTLGSSELFSKRLDSITASIRWEKYPYRFGFFKKQEPTDVKARLLHLEDGSWTAVGGYDHALFHFPLITVGGVAAAFLTGEWKVEAMETLGEMAAETPEAPALPEPAPPPAPPEPPETAEIAEIAAEAAEGVGAFELTFADLVLPVPDDHWVRITLDDLEDLSTSVEQTLDNPPYTGTSRAGFIKLELGQDFGHAAYQDEKTKALIELAGSTNPTWSPKTSLYNYDPQNIPREPFTPKISDLRLSYRTLEATPTSAYFLLPFGHVELNPAGDRLLPSLPYEGELYIGVEELDPPEGLSLLFRAMKGTANPLTEPPALHWSYLKGNGWVELEDRKVEDATGGLAGTGIIRIAVPEDADTEHTLLPDGLHWFRMAVEKDVDAISDLRGVHAQAASATFVNRDNDPDFLATPLPAGSVEKLEVSDARVKSVTQPDPSFGGRPVEALPAFRLRASERLRHKDRAITMWDYERLVLERFPSLFKAKCINHTRLIRDADSEIVADNELAPGHVLVVTLPYVQAAGDEDRLRPYTEKRTLAQVKEFLEERTSPFVQLEVQNPKFEEVQAELDVAFRQDIADTAFYQSQLEEALVRFLTPWAYEEGVEISFGGTWHKSALIDFVEELPYVDYVKRFRMYHNVDPVPGDDGWPRVDEEVIRASTSRSIFVSHPEHRVHRLG